MDSATENQIAALAPSQQRGGVADLLRSLVGWGFRATARFRRHTTPALANALPSPHSDKPLIVMIHGFQGDPAEFDYLQTALRHTLGEFFDFTVIDNLDPGNDPSPDENCRRIADYLADNHLSTRELYLIGHSMGGLIARRFPYMADDTAVKAMVLIGTPNGGVNGWNLLPIHWLRSNGFQERINLHCPANPDIRYLLVGGTKGRNFLEGQINDGVVGLWSVLHFNECNRESAEVDMRTYPHDHWGLLRSKRVAHDVAAFLLDVYRGQA